jgi:hypothetical protein
MCKRALRLVISLVVLFTLFATAWWLSIIPHDVAVCSYSYENGQQECSRYNSIRFAIWRSATFFDEHNWIIATIFAGLLTLFTWRLWRATADLKGSTDKLWEAGEKQIAVTDKSAVAAEKAAKAATDTAKTMEETAERQLRAYITVESVKYEVVTAPIPHNARARVAVKNYGQTPAYDLTVLINADLGEYPLTHELEPLDEQHRSGKSVMAPGGNSAFFTPLGYPIIQSKMTEIADGKVVIYVYGDIQYRDAFDKPRGLKFRVFYGGHDAVSVGAFAICPDGNEYK